MTNKRTSYTGRRLILMVIILLAGCISILAQGKKSLAKVDYRLEMQGSLSDGNTPLWLNANRYGLSSLEETNGYVRAVACVHFSKKDAQGYEDNTEEPNTKWDASLGLDMVKPIHYTSPVVVQQAFGEVRWLKGALTVGSKEWPMELKNPQLSSGSQTLGINARPVPQIRLALSDYWTLPFANGWLHLKGHIAYGMMTDDHWQHDFTQRQSKYADHVKYHSKAGYLKIGNAEVFCPWSVVLGLEMATQFGGTAYVPTVTGSELVAKTGERGLKGLWHAFLPGGADTGEDTYQNVAGNQLGSWLLRVNYDGDDFAASIYVDKFFEDHSGMFMIDYDGYGEGSEWQQKTHRRVFVYAPKDMMLGAELGFKQSRWVDQLLFEYLYTKYQSGPIYHDHTAGVADHLGGKDNYYDHYIYPGWQHWGQVMGNPLFRSPIYNDGEKQDANGKRIEIGNSRFVALHAGLSGEPLDRLRYRLLATWQEGLGTYERPWLKKHHNVSLMGEVVYRFDYGWLKGVSLKGAAGTDIGGILGNNYGFQLTIAKSGRL